MTEHEMHLMSFVGYVRYAITQPAAVADYRTATGDSYTAPVIRAERLIDAASGADREFVRRFVDWCAGHYGRDYLPPDFLDRVVPPAAVPA